MSLKKTFKKIWVVIFVFMVFVVSAIGCAPTIETSHNASTAAIQVYFKLDPRLLGPTYGGQRWVSPSTYGPVQAPGETYVIEARAEAIDKSGQPFHTNFEWHPENSEMVSVKPGQDDEVMITIKGPGESRLQVTSPGGASKTLHIKALYSQNNAIQVEISQ